MASAQDTAMGTNHSPKPEDQEAPEVLVRLLTAAGLGISKYATRYSTTGFYAGAPSVSVSLIWMVPGRASAWTRPSTGC